jgi:hypothetical protein
MFLSVHAVDSGLIDAAVGLLARHFGMGTGARRPLQPRVSTRCFSSIGKTTGVTWCVCGILPWNLYLRSDQLADGSIGRSFNVH